MIELAAPQPCGRVTDLLQPENHSRVEQQQLNAAARKALAHSRKVKREFIIVVPSLYYYVMRIGHQREQKNARSLLMKGGKKGGAGIPLHLS